MGTIDENSIFILEESNSFELTPSITRKSIRSSVATGSFGNGDIEEADVSGNEVAVEVQESNFYRANASRSLT